MNEQHVVLDDSAAVAAGSGNVLASRLILRAHTDPCWFLYVPTCVLVEADRTRPGTAEHLAALPGVTILHLDLPAALAIAGETTWATAHARHAAEPSVDRPGGAAIATVEPDRWKGARIPIINLSP